MQASAGARCLFVAGCFWAAAPPPPPAKGTAPPRTLAQRPATQQLAGVALAQQACRGAGALRPRGGPRGPNPQRGGGGRQGLSPLSRLHRARVGRARLRQLVVGAPDGKETAPLAQDLRTTAAGQGPPQTASRARRGALSGGGGGGGGRAAEPAVLWCAGGAYKWGRTGPHLEQRAPALHFASTTHHLPDPVIARVACASLPRQGNPAPPLPPHGCYLSRSPHPRRPPHGFTMAPGPVLPRTTDPLLICTDSSAPPKWNTILTRIRARGEVYPLQVCRDSAFFVALLFAC